MRLKSFSARSIADAMAQIRAELGEDAIIVATHGDDAGGVLVTAAVEETEPAFDERPGGPAAPSDREPADVVDVIYRAFRDHGVPSVVGEPLLEWAGGLETANPVAALTAALRRSFRFAPVGETRLTQPLMLVGPPGSGKTQTTAKLAARGLMAGRRVAVLTTDTLHTGGAEQLSAFTEVLHLDLTTVGSPQALADGLTAVRTCDWVLVDSAGRNHLDVEEMTDLMSLLNDSGVEPLLILPAGLDTVEAGDIASAFKALGAWRMILTRVDMTRRLGSILAAAAAADLAFAEISPTPRIKNGLTPIDARSLARLLLRHWQDDARRQQTGTSQ